jgi:trigger factor
MTDPGSARRPFFRLPEADCIIECVRVSAERIPDSQVVLEIEVEPEQMERSMERAYRRLVQRAEIPGFRKGKAPREMLERHLGRDRLLHEAIDILLPEAYNQALDEQAVEAIDQPRLDVVQEEPLIFKATVPVRPTVDLGDYASLRVKRPKATVDPKEVDAAVEELRHRYALHEPVERPVRKGDVVRAAVKGVIDGRQIFNDDDLEFTLRDGTQILLPGFAEGVVGAEKGVAKEVPVTVPEGQQELSGKQGTFTVVVKEVKEERMPELNDDFAREVGEGFASVAALRKHLEDQLRERVEAQAEEKYRDEALTALTESAAKLEFPPVLIDREMEHILRDEARAAGQEPEAYLQRMSASAEQVQEVLKPVAEERVKRSLVLSELAEAEGIKVEASEVNDEIERMVGSSGAQAPQMRQLFEGAGGRQAIERSLRTRKTLDRLTEIVAGPKRSKAKAAGKAEGESKAKAGAAKPRKRKAKAAQEDKA